MRGLCPYHAGDVGVGFVADPYPHQDAVGDPRVLAAHWGEVGVALLVHVPHEEAELVVVAGQHHRPLAAADCSDDVTDDVDGDVVAVLRELAYDPLPTLLLESRHGGGLHQVFQNLKQVNSQAHYLNAVD